MYWRINKYVISAVSCTLYLLAISYFFLAPLEHGKTLEAHYLISRATIAQLLSALPQKIFWPAGGFLKIDSTCFTSILSARTLQVAKLKLHVSKKQLPILYSKLLYKMGSFFLDILYIVYGCKIVHFFCNFFFHGFTSFSRLFFSFKKKILLLEKILFLNIFVTCL